MTATRTRWAVLVAGGLLFLAGCGGAEKPTVSPTTRAATPTATSTPSPTPSPSSAVDSSISPCLISKADLNAILAGNWSQGTRNGNVCLYRSGRGGIFGITNVQEPDPERGLEDARAACDTKPREIPSKRSFACVERTDSGDVISGNLTSHDQVWLVTIVSQTRGGAHEPELKAMVTILGALPAD